MRRLLILSVNTLYSKLLSSHCMHQGPLMSEPLIDVGNRGGTERGRDNNAV